MLNRLFHFSIKYFCQVPSLLVWLYPERQWQWRCSCHRSPPSLSHCTACPSPELAALGSGLAWLHTVTNCSDFCMIWQIWKLSQASLEDSLNTDRSCQSELVHMNTSLASSSFSSSFCRWLSIFLNQAKVSQEEATFHNHMMLYLLIYENFLRYPRKTNKYLEV